MFDRLLRLGASAVPASTAEADVFGDDFLERLESLALTSRRAASGASRGERRARKRGSGVEFADHRPYVAGDDIRFLDFSVYRRFGKLLLRVFEEEEDLSVYLVVDCSASMGTAGSAKLRQAQRLAAALAYVALTSLDRVGLVAVTDRVTARLAPTRGRQRVFRVLEFLRGLRAEGPTDLRAALERFVVAHRRRGLVILLSDLFDPVGFEAGLKLLRYSNSEVGVLELTAAEDARLPELGDLRLVDAETGRARDVTVTEALARAVAAEQGAARERNRRLAAAQGVPHFVAPVEQPFDAVILDVLRRGGLLR